MNRKGWEVGVLPKPRGRPDVIRYPVTGTQRKGRGLKHWVDLSSGGPARQTSSFNKLMKLSSTVPALLTPEKRLDRPRSLSLSLPLPIAHIAASVPGNPSASHSATGALMTCRAPRSLPETQSRTEVLPALPSEALIGSQPRGTCKQEE